MSSVVRERSSALKRFARIWKARPMVSTSVVLLLLIIIQTLAIGFDYPTFADWFEKWFRNWVNIISNNAYVGIISLGMTLVIISGGIDLAVGSTLACVGAVMMVLMDVGDAGLLTRIGITGMPALTLSLLIGIALGALLGEGTGLLIAKGRIPPFIVTLGTMKILRSLTLYFMRDTTRIVLPDAFLTIAGTMVGGYRMLPIFYWVLMAAVVYVISRYTVFGRHVYAVGSNERATRLSGVNVDKVKRRVYSLMGFCVSIATIVQVSRIGSMDYVSTGSGYELDAIAAVIVGGTSMAGGRGSVMGTVLGMLIISVMNNLLTLVGVHPFLREAFKGAIIIAAVLLQRKQKEA